MAKSIVITSGKGGVGKSTFVTAIGRILTTLNRSVALVDTDFGLNNLDVLLGAENRIVYDIIDVIENRCRLRQALVEDCETKGLFILPSAHTYDQSRVNAQSIKAVVNSLKTGFDYVLIDSPAGIETGFHRAVGCADEAIVVSTPHLSALHDADKTIKIIRSYQLNNVSLVLNRVRGDKECDGQTVSAQDASRLLGVELLGVIPEDDKVNEMSTLSLSLDGRSEGYKAMEMVCKKLINGKGEVYDPTKKYCGVFGAIRRKIKKII